MDSTGNRFLSLKLRFSTDLFRYINRVHNIQSKSLDAVLLTFILKFHVLLNRVLTLQTVVHVYRFLFISTQGDGTIGQHHRWRKHIRTIV